MKQLFLSSFLFLFLVNFISFDEPKMDSLEEGPLPCVEKEFPLVIHIVKDSLGNDNVPNIQETIDSLNTLYAPICMSFNIWDIKIIDNHSYDLIDEPGEYGELVSIYSYAYRINIFVADEIGVNNPFYDPGVATYQGITQPPTSLPSIGLNKSVFTLTNNHLAHYMGEYMGLRPTSFDGNGDELVDGSNCATVGDGLCETPADPLYPESAGFDDDVNYYQNGCRFIFAGKDANNEFYNPDISNIMSYYVNCRCTFTDSQYELMANTYLSAPGNTW